MERLTLKNILNETFVDRVLLSGERQLCFLIKFPDGVNIVVADNEYELRDEVSDNFYPICAYMELNIYSYNISSIRKIYEIFELNDMPCSMISGFSHFEKTDLSNLISVDDVQSHYNNRIDRIKKEIDNLNKIRYKKVDRLKKVEEVISNILKT